jgi:hypothetical protein
MIRRGAMARFGMLAVAMHAGAGCRGERLEVEPLALPTAMTRQSGDAALAVDPESGDLLLSWVGADDRGSALFLTRSADEGRLWSRPVLVAGGRQQAGEVQPHGESSPRLIAGPGRRVALTWPSSVPVQGRKWPATMVRLARSEDGGETWSRPVSLNDDSTGTPVSHQFHGAAWQGDSGLVVAWLDERHAASEVAASGTAPIGGEPDATIYAASSPDFGRSWSANTRLWGAACPCCRVTLARAGDGAVMAAWRQHFPGSVRDVVVAPMSASVPDPHRVHADEWTYAGCPHTGPAMAAQGAVAHVAWYSGKPGASGVFYRRVGAGSGHPAGPLVPVFTDEHVPTAHPAVVPMADGGALVAYDVGPKGARLIGLARITADGRRRAEVTVAGSQGGTYPQLARTSADAVILAYTVTAGDTRQVRAARVRIPR